MGSVIQSLQMTSAPRPPPPGLSAAAWGVLATPRANGTDPGLESGLGAPIRAQQRGEPGSLSSWGAARGRLAPGRGVHPPHPSVDALPPPTPPETPGS